MDLDAYFGRAKKQICAKIFSPDHEEPAFCLRYSYVYRHMAFWVPAPCEHEAGEEKGFHLLSENA